MSDIFREVDEDVRRDKTIALAKKWAPLVVGSVIGIVVATSVSVYLEEKEESERRAESAQYEAAVEMVESDRDTAISALESLAQESTSGYAAMAHLRAGAEQLNNGDKEAAIASFQAAANDQTATVRITDLAKLNAATLLVDMGRFDEARPMLEELAQEGNAWEMSAKEMLAFQAYQAGDFATAEDLYQQLSVAASIPPALKQRAIEMLAITKQKNTSSVADDETPENNQ